MNTLADKFQTNYHQKNNNMKKYAIEIKWSMIFIGVSLLWILLERIAGLHDEHINLHPIITLFFMIPAIWMYVAAIKEKKNACYGGQMTFIQGLLAGIIMTLIITAVTPLTQYFIAEYVTPNFFPNAIIASVKEGYYQTEAEAREHFNYENYALTSTIGAFVMGLITTVVVSAILKTKKNLI